MHAFLISDAQLSHIIWEENCKHHACLTTGWQCVSSVRAVTAGLASTPTNCTQCMMTASGCEERIKHQNRNLRAAPRTEILLVSIFQVCEAPSLIRSSKRERFDQLIAFTSYLPHVIEEGKQMMIRHKHRISFLSQSPILAKIVYCLNKFLRRKLQFQYLST